MKLNRGGIQMNKAMYGVFALGIVALLGVSFVAAGGFGKGLGTELSEEEMTEMQEQEQAMRDAIENEDYEAWKELMEERIAKMQEQITEENFNEIVERNQEMNQYREQIQEALEAGDYETARELREESGFGGPGFGGRGHQEGFGPIDGSGECPFAK